MQQKIIDSHIHLWDLSLKKNNWLLEPVGESFLGDYSPLQQSYLITDYLNDSGNFNIEKVVYVQAGWDRNDLLGETQWLINLKNSLIGAITAYANLNSIKASQQLEALSSMPLVTAIRQTIAWHENPFYCSCEADFLNNPSWINNFKLLHQNQLSFDMQIFPEQTEAAYGLIKSNPDIAIVIEHALQPTSHNHEALKRWEQQVKKLAELPNCYIKLSGMLLFTHRYNLDAFQRIFETCVHYFSPQRCMIGSNFPVEKLYISFDELFNAFFTITAQYNKDEQNALFFETAKKFYRIT